MNDQHTGFVPWSKRNTSPDPKIKQELTNKARSRLANVISECSRKWAMIETARKYEGEFGEIKGDFTTDKSVNDLRELQIDLLERIDKDKALTYIELLLNTSWAECSGRKDQVRDLMKMDNKIRRTLTEERIMLELKPGREKLPRVKVEDDLGREQEELYNPNESGSFQFEKLADQSFVEADQELRALTKGERWEDELTGYNEAWELYEDGTFTFVIAEKLYNSLEAVTQKICVDLEGWENENQSLGTYVSRMQEEDLFKPNDAMQGEWRQILSGIETGVNRTGSDRKRHESIDQDYAILLLHQVASFLSFIIKRYESKYGSDAN
jgi:hypothetical protein